VAQTEEENFGTVASPPRTRHFLDTQYGIRKDALQLMIGYSPVFIDTDDNLTIKGTTFRGSVGLWELLTRKKVNTEVFKKADLKTVKKILIVTNAHLNRYQPGGNINITRGKKLRHVIAPLFAKPKGRGVDSALRHKLLKY